VLRIGSFARVKDEAWDLAFPGRPNPGARIIIAMPQHTPFDRSVLLSYPFYWWDEDDLEEAA